MDETVTSGQAHSPANHTESDTCGSATILAIAGCTNSGKTTMAKALMKLFYDENVSAELVHQDDFFLEVDKVEKVYRNGDTSGSFYYNYDVKDALDTVGIVEAVVSAAKKVEYVVLEGNMITEIDQVMHLVDRVIFLTLNMETCRRRRNNRIYVPPDTEGYFDEVVWPAYVSHLRTAMALAREDKRIAFLDVSTDNDEAEEKQIIQLMHCLSNDFVRITFDPLDVSESLALIGSPSCGAISLFVGTTRDTFNDRSVVRLDYESYDEMAHKEMRRLCSLVRARYPTIQKVLIFHRIGEVAIGEASVIIATASPHRKDAIQATELAIDELKRTVPIWKKEVYADGGCSWKENGEWRTHREHSENQSTEERKFADASASRDQNRKVFWLRQMVRQLQK